MNLLLKDKRVLITGVASSRSIAWGIAQAMKNAGATLAFTHQNERLKSRVEQLASQLDSTLVYPCDVADDQQIQAVFEQLDEAWDGFDILVHSVAFAEKEQLAGGYLENLTRKGFLTAHEISSYSFAALANAARSRMQGRNAAMLTLSYIGAERVMPNYNVMGVAKASLEANVRYMAVDLGPLGIRVNAISAGPIRTLAAAGIKGLRGFLAQAQRVSPLRRNVTIEEVGNAATFLCSDYASAITGEITYVDCGYNVMGAGTTQDVGNTAEA